MKIIRKDMVYRKDIDILARVYENQDVANQNEQEQICFDILFKPHLAIQHIRGTAWLPRGAVAGIVEALNIVNAEGENNYLVQISNELPDDVGALTHCRQNFNQSVEWDKLDL